MLLYLKLTYLRSVLKSFDNFFDFVHWGKCIVRFLPKKMWESLHLNRTIFPKLFKYQTDQSRLQKPFIKIDLVKDRSHDIGSSMFYFHYLLDHLILHLELHLQASRCGGLPRAIIFIHCGPWRVNSIRRTVCLSTGKTNYALHVHISSEGRCSYFHFPSFLFQSQVGHSLTRQVLSCPQNQTACIVTSLDSVLAEGLSIKKAESSYSHDKRAHVA